MNLSQHPYVSFIIKDSEDWWQVMREATSIEINEQLNQLATSLGVTRKRQFRWDRFQGFIRYEGKFLSPLDQYIEGMAKQIDEIIFKQWEELLGDQG